MAGLHFDITGDNTNLMEKLKEVERGVKSASASVEKEGGSIEQLFSRMSKAAAAFGAGFTAKELIQNIVQVRGEFQQLEVAFTTMLGSQEKAASLMSQLTETAAKTPFDLQGVANGARQLLAYGTAAEDVNETLVRLGNIAAGLSIPLNDLVYLYGTTMTQGRLYTQDLNQFTGRGIPMIKELAKEFGVAESEIKSMVEAGKIGFPEVQKVIQNLTDEGGMFYNLMQEQSKTITGQISNIGDSFSMMLNEIGKANEGIINDALGGVSYLIENYETVGKVLLEIVGTYGAYRAALITITALQKAYSAILAQSALNQSLAAASGVTLSNAQALAATRTKLLQMAQAALNKTLLANPYVAAAAAVASLGLGIYKLVTYQTEAEKAQERLNESVAESKKASLSEQRELSKLKGELSALKEGTDEYNTVKEKIIAGYSKYYDGLEEEINKVGLTEEAYKRLTDAITQSYGARQYQQFKSQQESELDAVMSENLGKIQERLIDKLGEEAGSRYYAKIRDAIMQGNLTAINGTANISGLDRDTNKALDKAASVGFGIENRAIESYIATILNAIQLTDELDKKARQKFGVTGIRSESQSSQAPFSAEGKSISQLEEEIGKAQTKLESLKKAFADGSGTKEAVSEQEAYIKSLQDTVLEREKDLKVINEVKTQISKLEKDQGETVSGSEEYNALQSRIDALRTKLPKTKSDKAAEDKQAKEKKETEQKLSDELLELQRENQEQETALMEEGKAKKLKQIDDDYEARKAEIKKKSRELAELNKKAGISGTNGNGLTAEQQKEIDHASELNDENKIKQSNEVYKAERDAMNRYLQEYGTFQQKRLAITEEYQQKISKAETEGEKLLLQKQMEEALSGIDMDELKESINWELVFSDLGNVSKKSLQQIKKQLGDFKESAEYKDMGMEQKKVVDEALNNIQSAIIDKGGLLGDLPTQLEELRKAQEDLTQAQEEYNKALAEGTDEQKEAAQKKLNKSQQGVQNAQLNVERSTKTATDNLLTLGDAITQLGGNSEMTLSEIGQLAGGIADTFAEAGSKIGGIIGAIFTLLDQIGKQGLDGFLENVFSSVGSALYGVFDTLLGWGGFDFGGESDPTLERDIERLTTANQELEKAINNLSDKMDESSLAEALDIYEVQKENIQKMMANTRDMMYRSVTASSDGFLGIGGHHSSGYKIDNGMSAQDWEAISKVIGRQINGAGEFFMLSSEEMWKVANEATTEYAKLKELADDGYKDAAQFMDEYIGYWQELENLENEYREKLTSVSFDTIRNDFRNALLGMEDDAEAFSENFEKMMKDAVLESMMTEKYDKRLKDWYKLFSGYMEGGYLGEGEQDDLRDEWQGIVNDALEEWKHWQKIMGWDTESSTNQQQSASSGGYETMTQDQASELNGRFTALYEVGLQIYNTLLLMQTITVSVNEQNSVLFEIRNLIISSNGYLEDMSGLQKKIYELLNASIPQISNQLNKL